jgi:hypothetical protein
MPSEPEPVSLDLGDFDAVGIATEIVHSVRSHAIERSVDTTASVSAPDGWHRLIVTALPSGHVVLSVRHTELSESRRNNVASALARREWQLDEDDDGATRRFPPGVDAADPAFEILATLTLSGAPTDVRQATAVDATGTPVTLL